MGLDVPKGGLPDPGTMEGELDDLACEDWVSLFMDGTSEFDNLVDTLPDNDADELHQEVRVDLESSGSEKCRISEAVGGSASPASSLTQLSRGSSGQENEDTGSGTEQCRSDEERNQSPGFSNSKTNSSKRLGKRKIANEFEDEDNQQQDGEVDEEEQKRRARLMRNRESAQLSRQRKKAYVDELEERVRTLNSTVAELNNTIALISAENVSLRSQLAYFYHSNGNVKNGTYPPPPVGMPVYPYAAGYTTLPMRHGASAPSIPIPRLKTPASSVSVKRAKVTKEDTRKAAGTGKATAAGAKTKRMASVAALGLLCVMMVFFPGLPGMQKTLQGGTGVVWPDSSSYTGGSVARVGGRVLMSTNNSGEQLELPLLEQDDGARSMNDCHPCRGRAKATVDGSIFPANVSVSGECDHFEASLLVPRDNKVVKIDGDLIIQAVMAGDRAASSGNQGKEVVPVTGTPALMTSSRFGAIIAEALDRKRRLPKEQQALPDAAKYRALPSGDAQRELLSDLGGTVFDTGVCTEVFQLDVPAKSETQNGSSAPARKRNGYSRRNLSSAVPLPPPPKDDSKNETDYTVGSRRPSSMVVSILSSLSSNKWRAVKDPSQVFVVVLIDGVKYVTYSCPLPQQPRVVSS